MMLYKNENCYHRCVYMCVCVGGVYVFCFQFSRLEFFPIISHLVSVYFYARLYGVFFKDSEKFKD